MLPVRGEYDATELKALRELNVMLLLAPAGAVAGLRERVAALPPRRRRREESAVGVPVALVGRARVEEPGEDEDHDHP